jgi:hypothetical protein
MPGYEIGHIGGKAADIGCKCKQEKEMVHQYAWDSGWPD